jgi:hypothetical protein
MHEPEAEAEIAQTSEYIVVLQTVFAKLSPSPSLAKLG